MAVTAPALPWHTNHSGVTTTSKGDARSFCRRLLETQAYRDRLEKEAIAGVLPPAVEQMLWYFAYGKPVEQVKIQVSPGEPVYEDMSLEELKSLMDKMQGMLDEALELEAAIPASYTVVP